MQDELQLSTGERVLWTGEPQRVPLFERTDWAIVPLSLVWFAFVLVWEGAAVLGGGPVFMQIWGGLFVAFGLYFTVGRLFVRQLQRRSTTYTVTDRRIVAQRRRPWRRRTEVYLRMLQPPVVREDATGDTGSIAFGEFPGVMDALRDVGVQRSWRRGEQRPMVLHGIARPRHVREVIAQAQR
ncbi:hypothetical protein OHA72_33150 [Dactylosporangium sp. NBC_01737]|uniref:hypothetical protein n=1 Tax=Dactylosporangium sp. NBC_01737 TaxID=2975959 RepID=UPI002E0E0B6F|nr:hypothetical protein OHA72_33150 [Dactylosporangium sp. NBC_01737]